MLAAFSSADYNQRSNVVHWTETELERSDVVVTYNGRIATEASAVVAAAQHSRCPRHVPVVKHDKRHSSVGRENCLKRVRLQ